MAHPPDLVVGYEGMINHDWRDLHTCQRAAALCISKLTCSQLVRYPCSLGIVMSSQVSQPAWRAA